MSIDIDWETLTTGPEGQEFADSIKEFVHDKFQQVELPRFIRSVQVHSFDFGKECPVVELKDICDPLPEFYENDDEEGNDDEEEDDIGHPGDSGRNSRDTQRPSIGLSTQSASMSNTKRPPFLNTRLPGLRLSNLPHAEHITTPFLSRSNTPGIPGGTSNLSYFHLPLSSGLSGSQTPLAAVAGGHPNPTGWPDHRPYSRQHSPVRRDPHHQGFFYADPSSRPSTADSYTQHGLHSQGSQEEDLTPEELNPKRHTPSPSDLQIVLHISYSGSLRLSITAEILLDYPMPSFVGIPLKLNITGLSFDGVALIAYLRKRAHFCFLGTEDAQTLVGVGEGDGRGKGGDKLGGLLREIRVESEIGRKEGGKQVLKNVGKVEKFVLEQSTLESTPLTISPPHHHPPNNPRNPTLSPRHPFAAPLPIISNRALPRPHPSPSNPHQSALKPSPGMFSLLLTALPTTIGVAQGVSAAKKEKESQDSDDLLRKFTLRCSIDDDELQRCPEAERWRGGGVVLRDGKLYIHPSTSTQPPAHPFTGFLISYPDPTRPTPAPLGLVSSISLDPPVLNWIYVDAVTREVKYGNRTQSREHVVGSWGRGRGWLELAGAEARERLGEGGGAVVGEEGGVRWGGEGVRVRLERVFLEGVVEGKEEGEGGRGRTKFEGGTTMLETGGKRE